MINMHTKFQVPIFIRSKDGTRAIKFKKVTLRWPSLFRGWFVIRGPGLVMYTKFEVHIFTRYGDRKGDAKCRKWGWFGLIRVVRGHSNSLQ